MEQSYHRYLRRTGFNRPKEDTFWLTSSVWFQDSYSILVRCCSGAGRGDGRTRPSLLLASRNLLLRSPLWLPWSLGYPRKRKTLNCLNPPTAERIGSPPPPIRYKDIPTLIGRSGWGSHSGVKYIWICGRRRYRKRMFCPLLARRRSTASPSEVPTRSHYALGMMCIATIHSSRTAKNSKKVAWKTAR